MPKPQLVDERTGFAINFALPDKLAVMVEHADSGFLKRDVEANNLAHGSLRSSNGRLRAYWGERLATDYPISRIIFPAADAACRLAAHDCKGAP